MDTIIKQIAAKELCKKIIQNKVLIKFNTENYEWIMFRPCNVPGIFNKYSIIHGYLSLLYKNNNDIEFQRHTCRENFSKQGINFIKNIIIRTDGKIINIEELSSDDFLKQVNNFNQLFTKENIEGEEPELFSEKTRLENEKEDYYCSIDKDKFFKKIYEDNIQNIKEIVAKEFAKIIIESDDDINNYSLFINFFINNYHEDYDEYEGYFGDLIFEELNTLVKKYFKYEDEYDFWDNELYDLNSKIRNEIFEMNIKEIFELGKSQMEKMQTINL